MKYISALFLFAVAAQGQISLGPAIDIYAKDNFFVFSSFGNGVVVSKSEVHDEYGQYSLTYQTANGIRGSERGVLRPFDKENVLIREGTYVYSSEGTPVTVNYVTDEKGNYHYVDQLPVTIKK